MFSYSRAPAWLLFGLVTSVLVRTPIWLATVLNVSPLLGEAALFDRRLWLADCLASPVLAAATLAVWWGLRMFRPWALHAARALAVFYAATNAVAAGFSSFHHLWVYVPSLAVALIVFAQTHRRIRATALRPVLDQVL